MKRLLLIPIAALALAGCGSSNAQTTIHQVNCGAQGVKRIYTVGNYGYTSDLIVCRNGTVFSVG